MDSELRWINLWITDGLGVDGYNVEVLEMMAYTISFVIISVGEGLLYFFELPHLKER